MGLKSDISRQQHDAKICYEQSIQWGKTIGPFIREFDHFKVSEGISVARAEFLRGEY